MTEFGPGLFALAPEDAIRKAGSIRRLNFYIDARIVGPDNRPLGPNETGELVLKGPSIALGLFQQPGLGRGHRRRRLVPHRRFGPLRRGIGISSSWTG